MLPRLFLAAALALSATYAAMTLPALAQSESTGSTTDGTTNGDDQGEKKATTEEEPEC